MLELGVGEGGGWLLPAARRQRRRTGWDKAMGWAMAATLFFGGALALIIVGALLTNPP